MNERRSEPRYEGAAKVFVLREQGEPPGIEGWLYDVSCGGLALLIPVRLGRHQPISVRLESPGCSVQRELRAEVRNVRAEGGGWYRLNCALLTRLTQAEVQRLRSAARAASA